jgi:hypothetical protein
LEGGCYRQAGEEEDELHGVLVKDLRCTERKVRCDVGDGCEPGVSSNWLPCLDGES